jgi:hypothetical protein
MVAISLSAAATALLNRVEKTEGASLPVSLLHALMTNAPSVSGRENIAEDILACRSSDAGVYDGLKSLANRYYTLIYVRIIPFVYSLSNLSVTLSR